MKLLRTIRLDPSDTFVFERAAEPGEWAVPGGFEFADSDPADLTGRGRQAFRAGFLGVASGGWSTLAVVSLASREDRETAVAALAHHLVARHGAPDLAVARAAATEEIDYSASLASHPEGTLVALHRTLAADGSIREQFRTLHAADAREAAQMPCSAGAFAIVDDDGIAGEAAALSPATSDEGFDLVGSADTRPGRQPS